jgi:transposase InsO family protein
VLWELSVVEQRYAAVQEVLGGMAVTQVADRYGVSRQSVHGWLRRYQAGGLAGLEDRSHRPRSCPHQAPAQVEAAVCELRRQHPSWGPLRLQHELQRRGVVGVPSRAGIYRILVRHHLVEPGRRRRRRSDFRRWGREAPMQLWQLDVVGGIRLADGTDLKLVSGIDDHSRYCVIAALVARATGRAVCAAFAAALVRYGVPAEVLTDNGRQFTGRFGKPRPAEVLFDRICRENGITHRLTGVRSPTTTGKVERFHKTLRTELLATLPPLPSLEVAQKVIDGWVEDYNCRRPHQAIGMSTPAARFHVDQPPGEELPPRLPAPLSPPVPAPLTPLELEVVVPACGSLGLAGRQLWLGRRYGGARVRLWIDHQVIHLSLDGRLLKTVASRFTRAELPRLVQLGACPAGPPPTTTPAHQPPVSQAVEVDRLVNAAGLIGLGAASSRSANTMPATTSPSAWTASWPTSCWTGGWSGPCPRPSRPALWLTSKAPGRPAARCRPPRGRCWSNDGSPAKAASRSPARSSRSARAMPAPRSPSWSPTATSGSWTARPRSRRSLATRPGR